MLILEENTNRLSKIADFTDFDKIFHISQLVSEALPILTKFIMLSRLYYI
jgi:hypothetical protein